MGWEVTFIPADASDIISAETWKWMDMDKDIHTLATANASYHMTESLAF